MARLREWMAMVKDKKTCDCSLCRETRMLIEVNRYDESVMAAVTTKALKRALIEAICLGEYPVKKEEE
jgi:hypothetical protein